MKLGGGALLWTVFAILCVLGGWLFLRACAAGPVLGFARDYCPVPFTISKVEAFETGERLQREVHQAELAIAEQPDCQPSQTDQPRRTQSESKKLDETVEERGGNSGKLQLTLAWTTRDDLDLNVDCPGGRIGSGPSQRGPGICGDGIKDIDANRNLVENVSSTPVENIVWQGEIPEGDYKIEIIEFKAADQAGNSVPFTLRLKWNNDERICHDVVTTLPLSEVKREGETIIGGTYKTIVWHGKGPLPDCAFIEHFSSRGAHK